MLFSIYFDLIFFFWIIEKICKIYLITIKYFEKDIKTFKPLAKDIITFKIAKL